MNITIPKEILLEHLELLSKITTRHVTLPVLQCILIEAREDVVILRATNLEIGVEIEIKATVNETGTLAVPANILSQTIQYSTQKKVVLREEEGKLVVESDNSETTIKAIPHEEFPVIAKLTASGQSVKAELFSLGIKSVAFAASQSSIKPELGSVYIAQQKEHSLTFVATDSFRLMEKTVPFKNVILDDDLLVPQKNALELARFCDVCKGDPVLSVSENQCSLTFANGVYITSRLVTGSFPDYKQIIPKEYSTHATILKSDLIHVFKKTNIFLNKFSQVSMHVADNSITVSANNADVGTTTESLAAQIEGEELTLSFNQRYVSDPMTYVSDDSLILHFAGVGRPLVLHGVNDTSLRYLVMPMNK